MIEYRFVGRNGEFLMGVPARDLTAADVAEVEAREGIGREEIEASGLYENVRIYECTNEECTNEERSQGVAKGNWVGIGGERSGNGDRGG